ncbi:hypothetical protein D0N36_03390 [Hymenobacter lapidiphilus]|uniref:hypothetical protein n=1 Tax=Hymenobacter sp. CCM 8763 TaxID=2303334 RepID=UPI000E34B325|nr:hypothetical protein [Hymenobacter sp. CCM 8763]RFP66405.1 hypothetical protein D0N36_03390 [Hymenobacter sp. CCM 8763]
MIRNLPSPSDFLGLAHDCLIQAFEIIFENDKHLWDYFEAALQEDVWAYSQSKLNTAVVLIHQANEAFMKASICQVSPLLLLEGKRTDWPVMPQQKDKDFNDFYTTPSEALLYTYSATASTPVSEVLIGHIDAIRKLRNQIIHGIPKIKLTPQNLITSILNTYTLFSGKDTWWESFIKQEFNHPLAGVFNIHFELADFANRLEYIVKQIGKKQLAKHLSINIMQRPYFCPVCLAGFEQEAGDPYEYKWAFLKGTAKNSVVHCINCRTVSDVVRDSCPHEGCKGSVMSFVMRNPEETQINFDEPNYDSRCLTCGWEVYRNDSTVSDDDHIADSDDTSSSELPVS